MAGDVETTDETKYDTHFRSHLIKLANQKAAVGEHHILFKLPCCIAIVLSGWNINRK